MSTPRDPAEPAPERPRTNPVPLIVAAVVALAIVAGLAVLLLDGGDDDPTELSQGSTDGAFDPDGVEASGDVAPDVTFRYLRGSGPDQPEGRFSDFLGTPVVVNFFAEWCAPCVAEMPAIQEVFEEYAGEVAFLGINTNDTTDNARRIVRRTGVTYTIAHDESGEGVLAAFEGYVMPTTVFLDADGRVVRVWSGQIEADELRQVIEQDLLA